MDWNAFDVLANNGGWPGDGDNNNNNGENEEEEEEGQQQQHEETPTRFVLTNKRAYWKFFGKRKSPEEGEEQEEVMDEETRFECILSILSVENHEAALAAAGGNNGDDDDDEDGDDGMFGGSLLHLAGLVEAAGGVTPICSHLVRHLLFGQAGQANNNVNNNNNNDLSVRIWAARCLLIAMNSPTFGEQFVAATCSCGGPRMIRLMIDSIRKQTPGVGMFSQLLNELLAKSTGKPKDCCNRNLAMINPLSSTAMSLASLRRYAPSFSSGANQQVEDDEEENQEAESSGPSPCSIAGAILSIDPNIGESLLALVTRAVPNEQHAEEAAWNILQLLFDKVPHFGASLSDGREDWMAVWLASVVDEAVDSGVNSSTDTIWLLCRYSKRLQDAVLLDERLGIMKGLLNLASKSRGRDRNAVRTMARIVRQLDKGSAGQLMMGGGLDDAERVLLFRPRGVFTIGEISRKVPAFGDRAAAAMASTEDNLQTATTVIEAVCCPTFLRRIGALTIGQMSLRSKALAAQFASAAVKRDIALHQQQQGAYFLGGAGGGGGPPSRMLTAETTIRTLCEMMTTTTTIDNSNNNNNNDAATNRHRQILEQLDNGIAVGESALALRELMKNVRGFAGQVEATMGVDRLATCFMIAAEYVTEERIRREKERESIIGLDDQVLRTSQIEEAEENEEWVWGAIETGVKEIGGLAMALRRDVLMEEENDDDDSDDENLEDGEEEKAAGETAMMMDVDDDANGKQSTSNNNNDMMDDDNNNNNGRLAHNNRRRPVEKIWRLLRNAMSSPYEDTRATATRCFLTIWRLGGGEDGLVSTTSSSSSFQQMVNTAVPIPAGAKEAIAAAKVVAKKWKRVRELKQMATENGIENNNSSNEQPSQQYQHQQQRQLEEQLQYHQYQYQPPTPGTPMTPSSATEDPWWDAALSIAGKKRQRD